MVQHPQYDSTLEEAFKNARVSVCPGSAFVGHGGIPSDWTDVGGFVSLSPEDQTSHCGMWIHVSHVSEPLVVRGRDHCDRKRRPFSAIFERSVEVSRGTGDFSPLLCSPKVQVMDQGRRIRSCKHVAKVFSRSSASG